MHFLAPELIAQASSWFSHYGAITVLLGAMLMSEPAIIPFFILASQGIIELHIVFIFSFAGVMITDTFWFCVGILSRRNAFLHHHYENRLSPRVRNMFQKLFGKRILLAMVVMKFMYGTRILNLMWLGFRRFDLPEFMLYEAISSAVFILALGAVGFLIGAGISLAYSVLQLVGIALLTLLGLFLMYEVVRFSIAKTL